MGPRVRGCYWLDGPACGCRQFTIGGCRGPAGGLVGGGEVHCITGRCRGLGSRGCLLAIRHHIHGVFTLEGAWGPSSGERMSFWSRRGDWTSPAFPGEGIVVTATVGVVGGGCGAAFGQGFLMTSFGAGGVLASMGRTSMMKCAIWAGRVFLGASGSCVSESVAVSTLNVAIGLDYPFDFLAL